MNQLKFPLLVLFLFLSQSLMGVTTTHQTEEVDSYGNVTHYIRDGQNRLLEVIYPPVLTIVNHDEEEVIQYREIHSYDSKGNLIEHRDANGETTIATYDERNNPLSIQYPDGTFEIFSYFPDGSPAASTNRSGILREFVKNSRGEVTDIRITDRDGTEQVLSLENALQNQSQNHSIRNKGFSVEGSTEDTYVVNNLGQTVRHIKTVDSDSTTSYTFNAMGRLETKIAHSLDGSILASESFFYDGNGNCTYWKKESDLETLTVRNYFGPCGRIESSVENFGTPDETTTNYLYNEYGEPIWTDSTKDPIALEEQHLSDNVFTAEFSHSNISFSQEDLKKSLQNFAKSLGHYITQLPSLPNAIMEWLKTPDPLHPERTEDVSWLRWTLNHLLQWKEVNDVGIIGEGELGDHVRITYLNGMLNTPEEVLGYLENLSKMHGNANVHYVFRESNGFIKDVLKAGLVKAGYVSDHARDLVIVWKAMIEEMGGVDGGGTIIHYAHSLGAADTYVAGGLLTEAERQMIKVYTFGSPQIIPTGYFGGAVNYISRWDGVCLLGPYNFIKALFFKEPHVIYLESWDHWFWQDHLISYPTYNRIMMGLSSGIVTHFGPLVLDKNE